VPELLLTLCIEVPMLVAISRWWNPASLSPAWIAGFGILVNLMTQPGAQHLLSSGLASFWVIECLVFAVEGVSYSAILEVRLPRALLLSAALNTPTVALSLVS